MEYSQVHTIRFDISRPVSIGELGQSLVALERLVGRSKGILGYLYPDITLSTPIHLTVEGIRAGSLIDDIFVKFFYGGQENFDRILMEAGERHSIMTGLARRYPISTLAVSLMLVLSVNAGLTYLAQRLGESVDSTQIEINNSGIIQTGASQLEIPVARLREITTTALVPDVKWAKDSLRFLHPAKLSPGARVIFDENEMSPDRQFEISSEAIDAVPAYLAEVVAEGEHFEFKNDVEIEIRATDLDSRRRGWSAIIPDISPSRVTLKLDAIINPEDLQGARRLRGNLMLVYSGDPSEDNVKLRWVTLLELEDILN